jgi:uncharacterized Zn finger protein (UPF0148 family)
MYCDQCGERLEHFEGEAYCPDCTYGEAVEQMEQATDEALAQFAIDQADPEVMDWRGEQPPF